MSIDTFKENITRMEKHLSFVEKKGKLTINEIRFNMDKLMDIFNEYKTIQLESQSETHFFESLQLLSYIKGYCDSLIDTNSVITNEQIAKYMERISECINHMKIKSINIPSVQFNEDLLNSSMSKEDEKDEPNTLF